MNAQRVTRAVAAVALAGSLVWLWAGMGTTLFAKLTVAGITLGSIYALSGLGLVITYRASGVFNFAHGAMAMFVAYALWQLVRVWEVPLLVAAPAALLVVGPGLGVLLARYVFRPLDQRGAGEVENLVATVGAFVFLVGFAVAVWGGGTKTDPVSLFGAAPVPLGGGITISLDQLAIVLVTIAVSVGIYVLFDRTEFGLQMRAVVERRELAELTAVDANRVSMAAWAIGSGLAGLTGVLLAPSTFGLDPFHFTLLVAETFAVAIIARLASLSLALVGGTVLGLAISYSTQFDFATLAGWLGADDVTAADVGRLLDPILASIPVVALFVALVVHRRFEGQKRPGRIAALPSGDRRLRTARRVLDAAVVVALVVAPWVVDPNLQRRLLDMLALAVVFVSIVIVTGMGGHITLGQAAFAGVGAFLTGRLIAGSLLLPPVPVVVATVLAVAGCALLGVLVGFPALRRRGLVFGLTTFAVGLLLERFVFANYEFTAGPGVLEIDRPEVLGLSLTGDIAFHYYELAVLGLVLVVAFALRHGRTGRALTAMRDAHEAARAVGVRVRRYTMLLFVTSTAVAGLGGSLLAQTAQTFSSQGFGTFNSVIWFMAVVVAGVDTVHGALLGAFALTVLSALLGESGAITLLIGIGALALGRLPGGVVGLVRRLAAGPQPRRRRTRRLQPSPLARELLARARGEVAVR